MASVSNSNTKTEILKAYEDLVAELKSERKDNTSLRQELEKKQSLLEKASATVKTGASMNIRQIRQALDGQLEQLENSLNEEQKKFEMLQAAVQTEDDLLKNLYQIKAEAESLEALVFTHRQTKDKLESEMAARSQQLEADIKAIKKEWEREREDYDYNLKLKRRNEQDTYNEQKAKLEKDLALRKAEFEKNMTEREQAIAAQEEELKNLRKEVSTFEAKLTKAVADTEKTVSERLSKEFEYQKRLEIKDLEADLKLREQMIQNLEVKVKEQQDQVIYMSTKTDTASQQVKDIALKAIEKSGIVGIQQERRREEKE